MSALTAGCTGTTGDGKPSPASGSSPPTGSSSDLTSIKACDLLTESEAKGLGYSYPGDDDFDSGAADGCDWTISGKGGTSVAVRPEKGVKDLNIQGSSITDVKVGQFDAKRIEDMNGDVGSCAFVLSVTESSSVSVIGSSGSNTDANAACQQASKVADLVAAKLS